MANKPCPLCGALKWWWRDETGCSICVKEDKILEEMNSPPEHADWEQADEIEQHLQDQIRTEKL